MINVVFTGLIGLVCYCFFDDLILFAKNHAEMVPRVRAVLQRLHDRHMIVNAIKSKIAVPELPSVLGYHVTADGVKHSADKIEKAFNFPFPENKKRLKSF